MLTFTQLQLRLFSKIINEIAVSKIDSISHKNHKNHKSNQTILEWFQFDFIQMSGRINFFATIILSNFFFNVRIFLIGTKVRNIWFFSPLVPSEWEKNILILLSLYIFWGKCVYLPIFDYHMRAIITRGLYYFYPIFLFHWGLYYRSFIY